jgi:hypothetical protein
MKHPVVIPHLGATGGDVRILESRVGESALVAGGKLFDAPSPRIAHH